MYIYIYIYIERERYIYTYIYIYIYTFLFWQELIDVLLRWADVPAAGGGPPKALHGGLVKVKGGISISKSKRGPFMGV